MAPFSASSFFSRLSRKGRLIGLGALAIAGLGGAGLWLAGTSQPSRAQQGPVTERPVQVRVVKRAPLEAPKVLAGTIRARIETDQAFRVAGKIERRLVQAGDRVKAGDVLARLDAQDFRLQREAAEAELSASRSAEQQAEAERNRIAALRQQGWSTEQAFDRQKATLDEARGRRQRAERQVELARNAEGYAALVSEQDGVISGVFAEAGQVVAAGTPVMRIARAGEREVQIAIPERDIGQLSALVATLALWSHPEKAFPATLRELSPSADPATRTFLARFSAPDLPADTPLGMTATLTLQPMKAEAGMRVPLAAILNEGQGPEVFVVDRTSGEVARRKVSLRNFDAQDAFITAGLEDGEQVVTLGVHLLRIGQKVRVRAEERAA